VSNVFGDRDTPSDAQPAIERRVRALRRDVEGRRSGRAGAAGDGCRRDVRVGAVADAPAETPNPAFVCRRIAPEEPAMQVWIDQDCCTGAGLCVDHCPDVFVVLEDGIGYVRDGGRVFTDPTHPAVHVPQRYELATIDAVERCPGECIFIEPDAPPAVVDDLDIVDAEVVDDGS
jgi:ferredoxin